MANAIEQKVNVSVEIDDLTLTVEQRPDPPEGKKSHSEDAVYHVTAAKSRPNFPAYAGKPRSIIM